MSFARFGVEGSDVYVYESVRGGYVCSACCLFAKSSNVRSWSADRATVMIRHLEEHQAAGDTVPKSCFDALLEKTETERA